ncbi:MAG: hypothetical protein ACRDH9_13055 [Actinomycetota bacterium]
MTTNGDATLPQPPVQPPPPGPNLGVLRLLEMFLFTAVFIAGGVLAWTAAFGKSETAAAGASPPPIPAPAPTATIPDLGLPEFDPVDPGLSFTDQVQFSNARSEVDPPTGGCSSHIDYIWEIDRSLSPPISGRALIEVTGPGVGGDYHRPVQGNEIRLSLDITISGNSAFEADVVSVGGVPAFPTPLEATFTNAFC